MESGIDKFTRFWHGNKKTEGREKNLPLFHPVGEKSRVSFLIIFLEASASASA